MSEHGKILGEKKVGEQPAKISKGTKVSTNSRYVMRKKLKGLNYEEGEAFLSPRARLKESSPQRIMLQRSHEVTDPLKELANKIRTNYPAGFPVAIYQSGEKEFERQATNWAKREGAIGFKGGKEMANLQIGKAMETSESTAPGELISNIGKSVDALLQQYPASGETQTNANKINTVAIFTHATSRWAGVGSDIEVGEAKSFVQSIKSNVSGDVKVIIYGCSAGRGSEEKQDWYKGTMEGGGKGSLGEAIRDALADEGIKESEVWTHTTVGHTTSNFALRVFSGKKGKKGEAFFNWVFSTDFVSNEMQYFKNLLTSNGYKNVEEKWNDDKVRNYIRLKMYNAYANANESLKYKGDNLAEMAPKYPEEVIDLIQNYWTNTYRPKNEKSIISGIATKLKLKK